MQPPQQISSNSNNQPIPGLERPATAFLSYAREDAEEVKYLQQQLNVRGVRAWRDVSDLPLGGSNKDEITQAIEQEADAFVLTEYTCPYYGLAREHREVCGMEIEAMELALGSPVTLYQSQLDGHKGCQFQVKK